MELPHRKSRDDEESDAELEETNDVRSSLQGSLREGGPRSQDAGFLGRPPPGAAHRVTPSSMFLISTLVYAAC